MSSFLYNQTAKILEFVEEYNENGAVLLREDENTKKNIKCKVFLNVSKYSNTDGKYYKIDAVLLTREKNIQIDDYILYNNIAYNVESVQELKFYNTYSMKLIKNARIINE